MRSIAWLLVGGLAACACSSHELDLAKAVVEAEGREESARREVVRLERELDQLERTAGEKVEHDKAVLKKQLAAQREIARAAEIEARKLRIQSKQ